jgi:hypothetical protein
MPTQPDEVDQIKQALAGISRGSDEGLDPEAVQELKRALKAIPKPASANKLPKNLIPRTVPA